MRHRQKGRHLGRSSSHRKAMLRNLACSLFLTERDPDFFDGMTQADGKTAVKPPKFKGRVVTTLHKAKEVRPLVEKCITIAKKSLEHQRSASEFASNEERNSAGWKKWRESDQWQMWNQAVAPAIHARRRLFSMLRDKDAVEILLNDIAPRFETRPGGYTRIMQLAQPRLGDAGARAILELVGVHDRVKLKSEKPAFESETPDEPKAEKAPEPETQPEEVEQEEAAPEETSEEAQDDAKE